MDYNISFFDRTFLYTFLYKYSDILEISVVRYRELSTDILHSQMSRIPVMFIRLLSTLLSLPIHVQYVRRCVTGCSAHPNAFLFTLAYKPAFQLRNVSFSTMGREEQENEGTTTVCWHAHVRTRVFDPHDMTCNASGAPYGFITLA